MTWELVAVANAATAAAYLAISAAVFAGLRRTGQLWENRLGAVTGLIFLTAAVHHAAHLVDAVGWPNVVMDCLAAAVAAWYLVQRGSHRSVLRGAAMFEDLTARDRHALEIHDNIVQGLTVAKYALDTGAEREARDAVEDTLKKAQQLISQLLGDERSAIALRPGELHRSRPASVGEEPDSS